MITRLSLDMADFAYDEYLALWGHSEGDVFS